MEKLFEQFKASLEASEDDEEDLDGKKTIRYGVWSRLYSYH